VQSLRIDLILLNSRGLTIASGIQVHMMIRNLSAIQGNGENGLNSTLGNTQRNVDDLSVRELKFLLKCSELHYSILVAESYEARYYCSFSAVRTLFVLLL